MTNHYHHHNHGVGDLLSRIFWGFLIIMGLWVLVVFLMTWPWIFLLGCAILAGGAVWSSEINAKRYQKHRR